METDGSSGNKLSTGLLFSIIVIIFVLVISWLFQNYMSSSISDKHSYETVVNFESKMEEMKVHFPSQDEVFWKMLKNVGRRHLKTVHGANTADLRPLSFLVAGYAGTNEIMNCFLQKLGTAFTHMPFDVIYSEEYTTEQSKEKLDNKIKAAIQNKQKFVVIKNIDKLKFYVAQLFMTYADEHSDVASFPQSTIILTADMPFNPTSRHEDERVVANHFKHIIWKGEDTIDNRAALWTRIGDGLVLLKVEERNPCNKRF